MPRPVAPLAPSGEQRAKRLGARRTIIVAANRSIDRRGLTSRRLSSRHLHEAVAICRRRRLVTTEVLERAGFRGRR